MHGEQNQFIRNNVWYLVPRPDDCNVKSTLWIPNNKANDQGSTTRNRARLVTQEYSVDFDEMFAPVARLDSIRVLFVVACTLGFKPIHG